MDQTWIGGPTHEIKQQHIPGYQGHIAYLKSDCIFGKSFAKITNGCSTKQNGLQNEYGNQKCEKNQFQKKEKNTYYQSEFKKPQQLKQEFKNDGEYQEHELENLLKTKKQLQDQLKQEIEQKSQKITIDNVPPLDRIPIIGYQGFRPVYKKPIKEVKNQSYQYQEELFMTLQDGFQKELLRKDEDLRKKLEQKETPIVGYTGHIHQLKSENQYGSSYRDLVNGCNETSRQQEIINYNRSKQIVDTYYKPKVIFVLGGPGCGKGTVCQFMVDQYRMVHLSAGDLLRQEMNRVGSRYGQMINNYIKEGQIIPGEITVQLIEQAMRVNGWEKKVYLIDGFPRNLNNWDKFRTMLDYLVSVQFVMFFDCSNQTMQNRVMERSKNSGRTDDNMQTLLKRQKVFVDETMPVVKKYQVMNMVEVVDANTSREQVRQQVQTIMNRKQL